MVKTITSPKNVTRKDTIYKFLTFKPPDPTLVTKIKDWTKRKHFVNKPIVPDLPKPKGARPKNKRFGLELIQYTFTRLGRKDQLCELELSLDMLQAYPK